MGNLHQMELFSFTFFICKASGKPIISTFQSKCSIVQEFTIAKAQTGLLR